MSRPTQDRFDPYQRGCRLQSLTFSRTDSSLLGNAWLGKKAVYPDSIQLLCTLFIETREPFFSPSCRKLYCIQCKTKGIMPLRNSRLLVLLQIWVIKVSMIILVVIVILVAALIKLIELFLLADLCSFHHNPYRGKQYGVGKRKAVWIWLLDIASENVANHLLSFYLSDLGL